MANLTVNSTSTKLDRKEHVHKKFPNIIFIEEEKNDGEKERWLEIDGEKIPVNIRGYYLGSGFAEGIFSGLELANLIKNPKPKEEPKKKRFRPRLFT